MRALAGASSRECACRAPGQRGRGGRTSPQARRQDCLFFAVLRDGPPGNTEAVVRQQAGKLLIAKRPTRALSGDELTQRLLDRERGIEEIIEGDRATAGQQ